MNELDDNGESVLLQVFFTTAHEEVVVEIIDNFLQYGAQTFNVDLLMEQLGKRLPIFGHVELGPILLLQIAKKSSPFRVHRSEETAFRILRTFCEKFDGCPAFQRLEDEDNFTYTSVVDQLEKLKITIKEINE